MIQSLFIKNFILIDNLFLDFERGFSAFTGETGAGKSIVMDAIGLLCGDRINTNMIRTGTEKAMIEASFSITNSMKDKLVDAGFDDDECIVTREFDIHGKSVARINHRSVTASMLKDIIGSVVDIHSQHDHQYLLNQKFHLSLLDSYCNEQDLLFNTQKQYKEYSKLQKEYDNLQQTKYSEQHQEFLEYQIKEIEQANLVVNEDKELEDKIKIASNAEKILNKVQSAISLLEHDHGIVAQLYEATHQLRSLQDIEEIAKIHEQLDSAYYNLEDIQEQLHDYLDQLNIDERELNSWNERIFYINKLKRKYGHSIEDILENLSNMQEEVNQMVHREAVLEQKKIEVEIAFSKYETFAKQLHEIRVSKSLELQEEITKQLRDLMLPYAKFEVEINECNPNKNGLDDVCFLISMNPGEPLQPLHKVASGGELSRLMLGLKTIFTSLQGVELVIFDEIDSGVSGAVATSIGQKMLEIGKHSQVFSVTHLAQVAACANQHYCVSKKQTEDSTVSSIQLLNESQRIEQLAMIASGSITDASIQAATELLERMK